MERRAFASSAVGANDFVSPSLTPSPSAVTRFNIPAGLHSLFYLGTKTAEFTALTEAYRIWKDKYDPGAGGKKK